MDDDLHREELESVDLGTNLFRSNALAKPKGMVQVATSIGIWQFPEQGTLTAQSTEQGRDSHRSALGGRHAAGIHLRARHTDAASGPGGRFHSYPKVHSVGAANRMQLYDGKVYFRVDRNIYVIDPADWKVRPFNTSILGTKDPISDFIVRDDHMFIASGNKVVRMGLNLPIGPRVIPTITIEQVRSNNQPVDHHAPIRLSHQRNSIRINYSIPWFRDQQSLTIEYRLNDGEWRDNEPMSRLIDLPYLSPGDYNVQLRGRLADGRYTPTATVAIDIIPPLYARWWFQLLGVLLLGLGILHALPLQAALRAGTEHPHSGKIETGEGTRPLHVGVHPLADEPTLHLQCAQHHPELHLPERQAQRHQLSGQVQQPHTPHPRNEQPREGMPAR
jgi:hypothetical protein